MKKKIFSLLVCLGLIGSSGAQPLELLHQSLEEKWPNNRAINLVFHGHSVPAGYHKTPEVRPFESYPHLVYKKLKEGYPHAVINVMTTAIGGEAAVSGAARFEKEVLSLRPDLIFIDYALNDRRLPIEKAERAWVEMIHVAKKAGIPVVLITPTGDKNADMNNAKDPLSQRAQMIRDLASREEVILADVSKEWVSELKNGTSQDGLLSQRNHPNLKGHQLAADTIIEALQHAGLHFEP